MIEIRYRSNLSFPLSPHLLPKHIPGNNHFLYLAGAVEDAEGPDVVVEAFHGQAFFRPSDAKNTRFFTPLRSVQNDSFY
jgi:hypothetical protein